MRNWIRKSVFAIAGSALLMGGLAGCSSARHWSEDDTAQWRARMVEKVADKLELDAAQRAKLEVLTQKLHAQRMAVRAAGGSGEPRSQLQAVIAGAQFDRTAAQKLVDEKTGAVRTGSAEVIAAAADFFDSLNPAQQQKVREFASKRGRGHWGHRG